MGHGKNKLDFSLDTVPQRWFDAAQESGQTDLRPLTRARPSKPVPTGQRVDPFAAMLAGSAMCLAGGVAWFLLEWDKVISPWTVTVMGVLIGAAVRLGGGRPDPAVRGTISVGLFAVTTLVVSLLVVRLNLQREALDSSFSFLERAFLRQRVYDPSYALSTTLGALLAFRVNYLGCRDR